MPCFNHLVSLVGMLATLACATPQNGSISGTVADGDNQPVLGAAVVLCDHATGIPVALPACKPFTEKMQVQNIAFATTDEQGRFVLRDVQPGTYRLVAQSWLDTRQPIQNVADVNGRIVQLHGVSDRVEVVPGGSPHVSMHPVGTACLEVTTAPQAPNDDSLLVVSSEPMAADPILGFAAWSGPFMPNLLVANRMPHGTTTFRGLPEGICHLAAFANDNHPGFGGVRCEANASQTTVLSLPIIASWSDGHKQPPARLEPLVAQRQAVDAPPLKELLRRHAPEIAKDVDTTGGRPRNPWSWMVPLFGKKVDTGSGQQVAWEDLLAADAYARLLQHEADRKKGRKAESPRPARDTP